MALRSVRGRPVSPRGDTAEKVEAAAVRLFFDEGYPNTSIREITSELGLTPGAFYNHFGSKEDLLLSIISKTHAAIESTIDQALKASGGEPVRQLGEVTRALSVFYTEHSREAIISKREWRHLPGDEPEKMLNSERRIRRTIERILRRGFKTGQFQMALQPSTGVDLGVLAKAILDQIISAGEWFRSDGRLSARELAEQYGTFTLQMVGCDPDAIGDWRTHARSTE